MEPVVGVVMGSVSDWETMRPAAEILQEFGVKHETRVVSAHRTPLEMVAYAREARGRGLRVIVAGAGGAAHLPGMIASLTTLPVIGVPVRTSALGGRDSLLSIAQMPPGIPVATMAIGGGLNAGLMALRMLAIVDVSLSRRLDEYAASLEAKVAAMNEELAILGGISRIPSIVGEDAGTAARRVYAEPMSIVTDEEFALALAEADERNIRIEIVNGIGLWHFQPAKRHYRATTRIERSIRPDPQAGETGCGCVVLADVIVRFPDGSLLRPDVAVYCREPEEEDTAVTLIPEAVVEVVSKGSEMKDFEIGPAFYLGQGVKDVVVFDPFSLLTIHHRRDRPPVRYSETTEIRLECGCLVTV